MKVNQCQNGSAPAHKPIVPLIQGTYFLATGLWPLVDMRSFQAVTGPKVDRWLVKTVGVLVSVLGMTLVSAAMRQEPPNEAPLLGIGSAAGLAAVDIVYVSKRRISPIYLLDAVLEGVLIAGWLLTGRRRGQTMNSMNREIK